MNAPKNPFERDGYIAKEFGTITIGNKTVHFDVILAKDVERLLDKGEIVGRVGGRIVISDQVRSIPSSVSPMKENLLNTVGKGISENPTEQVHQSQLIRAFAEDELRKSSEEPKPYEGPCI